MMDLLLSPGQDVINVVICDSGILGAEHFVGTVANHGQHLLVANFLVAVDQSALLDDNLVQVQLHLGPFHDPLLHSVLRDQPEHTNRPVLPNTMSSIL